MTHASGTRCISLALLALLAAAGCRSTEGGATPKEAFVKVYNSMFEDSRRTFVACWNAEAEARKLLGAKYDVFQSMLALKRAVRKTYGDDAWPEIYAGLLRDGHREPLDEDDIAGIEVKRVGDKATCIQPARRLTMELVRVGRRWKADPGDKFNDPAVVQSEMERTAAVRDILEAAAARVGAAGESPESIRRMLYEQLRGRH